MIRKFARFEQGPERVRDLFFDIRSWPHWFPGIRTVRTIEESADRLVVDVTQDSFGREWHQRLEVRPTGTGFSQRQLQGKLKRWDLTWRFQPPPDGSGTTLSLDLDLDLGILGRWTPARVVQQGLDRLFADIVGGARERLHELDLATSLDDPGTEPLLAVVSTPLGLEIRWAGKRYRLVPID